MCFAALVLKRQKAKYRQDLGVASNFLVYIFIVYYHYFRLVFEVGLHRESLRY